jgi:hypothetical protein
MSNIDTDEPDASTVVTDPANSRQIFWAGLSFLVFALLMFYVLVTSWPVPVMGTTPPADARHIFEHFHIFGSGPLDWLPDQRMFLTVIAAGSIGSLIHTLTSLGDYIGNRKLSANWLWWFALRVPIGVALALVSYVLLRGGLIVPQQQQAGASTAVQLNPYAIAGFAALAGMFSRQATDKLREVFETLFTAQKPVKRDDPLNASAALKVDPEKLTRGQPQPLTFTGSGFQNGTKVTIGGNDRPFTLVSATVGKVTPTAQDVAKAGKLEIVVTNPNKDVFQASIEVVEAAAAAILPATAAPVISETDPKQLTATSPKSLKVIGTGFQNGSTATINGIKRDSSFVNDKAITVTLLDADIAQPGKLKLAAANAGQISNVLEVTVT